MEPKKIAEGYDQLAAHWASDAFPKGNGLVQHERAIAFLKENRRALDVGCGSSGRFIDLLLSRGFNVEGLDISRQMLLLAQSKHPDVVFYHADICAWDIPGKYDFISAWDSIWHVPLSRQKDVMKKLVNALEPGGVFIFTAGGVDSPEEKTDSFMGPDMYYSALGIPELLALVNDLGCECRHLEYDQYPGQHVYLIVQKASPGDAQCRC